MKKILFLAAIAAAFSTTAKAFNDEPEEGLSYQIKAGMNVTNITNSHLDLNAKVGATLGATVYYFLPNAKGTYLNAGLEWSQKGGQKSADIMVNDEVIEATLKQQLHYLQIPIHVGFHYNFSEKLGVYGEFGPYVAIGVGGNSYVNIDKDGTLFRDFEDNSSWSSFKTINEDPSEVDIENPSYQRWDAGLSLRVGAEVAKHYSLNLGFDWGLADLYRQTYRDGYAEKLNVELPSIKNFCFSMTVGYRF